MCAGNMPALFALLATGTTKLSSQVCQTDTCPAFCISDQICTIYIAIIFSRFNIASCTILDSPQVGLLLRNVVDSRVSGCLIRSSQDDPPASLRVEGGRGNLFGDNLLGVPAKIDSK